MRRNRPKKVLFLLAGAFILLAAGIVLYMFIQSLSLPDSEEIGLRYKTTQAVAVPDDIAWSSIGFAKELINQRESIVVVAGGAMPVPDEIWEGFTPRFPWSKNIDRNLLFSKTYFMRSPYAPEDCDGGECLAIREYKDYSWIELAQPVAVDYIPDKTNLLKPEPGHLAVKIIRKCQFIQFEDSIYQMTDNKGNFYVMHATETGIPDVHVTLPDGWTIQKVPLEEPLVIRPFGSLGECYYNVVGDHLGQGYHQYIYAGKYYPK